MWCAKIKQDNPTKSNSKYTSLILAPWIFSGCKKTDAKSAVQRSNKIIIQNQSDYRHPQFLHPLPFRVARKSMSNCGCKNQTRRCQIGGAKIKQENPTKSSSKCTPPTFAPRIFSDRMRMDVKSGCKGQTRESEKVWSGCTLLIFAPRILLGCRKINIISGCNNQTRKSDKIIINMYTDDFCTRISLVAGKSM